MLDLESPRWNDLSQAYGPGENLPHLLAQRKSAAPKEDHRSEPWFSLWSSLCHQGDVLTGFYAVVPPIIDIASQKQVLQRIAFLLISASIEAQKHTKRAPEMPRDLEDAYQDALRIGDSLALDCLSHRWSELDCRTLFGALSIFRGQVPLGNMFLNLDGDCKCPNCDTAFPPLGYGILEEA